MGKLVEALIMRHERQTWELLDVLFSEIRSEVSQQAPCTPEQYLLLAVSKGLTIVDEC